MALTPARSARPCSAAPLEVAAYGTYDAGLAFLTPTTSFEAAAVAPARWTRPPNHLDVCLYANGQPVPPEHTFQNGDRFTLGLTVPQTGFLYVVNVGPDGEENMLFPADGEQNAVSEGSTLQLLPADHPTPMVLTPPGGAERVYIVWSADPMAGPQGALAFARAEAGPGASALATSSGAGHTKGITRMAATPAIASAPPPSRCQSYAPQGDGDAWVLDLTVRHR